MRANRIPRYKNHGQQLSKVIHRLANLLPGAGETVNGRRIPFPGAITGRSTSPNSDLGSLRYNDAPGAAARRPDADRAWCKWHLVQLAPAADGTWRDGRTASAPTCRRSARHGRDGSARRRREKSRRRRRSAAAAHPRRNRGARTADETPWLKRGRRLHDAVTGAIFSEPVLAHPERLPSAEMRLQQIAPSPAP